MKKEYEVFSAHHHAAPVTATLANGTAVQASVDSLHVQLTQDAEHGGTIHLVFTDPSEIEAADELFVEGSTITATFSKGE